MEALSLCQMKRDLAFAISIGHKAFTAGNGFSEIESSQQLRTTWCRGDIQGGLCPGTILLWLVLEWVNCNLKSVGSPAYSPSSGLSRQPGMVNCASWSRCCSRCVWPLDVDSVYSQVSRWHCCAILDPALSLGTFCSTSVYLPTVSEYRETLPRWRLACHQEHCQRLYPTPSHTSPSVLSL